MAPRLTSIGARADVRPSAAAIAMMASAARALAKRSTNMSMNALDLYFCTSESGT
jgi:hypothetical protein